MYVYMCAGMLREKGKSVGGGGRKVKDAPRTRSSMAIATVTGITKSMRRKSNDAKVVTMNKAPYITYVKHDNSKAMPKMKDNVDDIRRNIKTPVNEQHKEIIVEFSSSRQSNTMNAINVTTFQVRDRDPDHENKFDAITGGLRPGNDVTASATIIGLPLKKRKLRMTETGLGPLVQIEEDQHLGRGVQVVDDGVLDRPSAIKKDKPFEVPVFTCSQDSSVGNNNIKQETLADINTFGNKQMQTVPHGYSTKPEETPSKDCTSSHKTMTRDSTDRDTQSKPCVVTLRRQEDMPDSGVINSPIQPVSVTIQRQLLHQCQLVASPDEDGDWSVEFWRYPTC